MRVASTMDRPVTTRGPSARRLLLWVALAALPLAGATFLFRSARTWLASETSASRTQLRSAVVVRGDLERDVSVQGRVVAAFHPTTFSPASGIVSLKVRAGDMAEKGQVLAVVASPEIDSRLKQEESTVQSLDSDLERQRILARQAILADEQRVDLAGVELEAARRAMRRAEKSRAEGIINTVEFERAEDDLRRADLALTHAQGDAALRRETLEFELKNRQLQVERQRMVVAEVRRQAGELSVRAPVAGLVSRLDVEDHDAVAPGQPLVSVVDLSAFEIEILVPESYADEIGPGTPAVVVVEGTDYPALVKTISPEVEASQVRGLVTFADTTPRGLRQSQRVSTRVILERRHDVLKVARGPFLEQGGGRQAYVVRGDAAELTPIEVGATSVAEVEILSGLMEGDRVIISDTTRFANAPSLYLRP